MSDLRNRIIDVVSGVFKLAPEVVARGVTPDQVEGWDSEKHVELVVALEERFGCMFEAEEVPELTSLDQMESIIGRHV
ncbi:acyl carrier protein [Candidatus Binatia bacterium]|nr:acyl carrier protein [Candidatus Binatia bacterium]